MIAKFIAAVTLLGASSVAAQGLNEPRWYAALDLGYHWPGEIKSHSTGLAPDGLPYDWQWKAKSDLAIHGRIGYRLASHWRVEGEFAFQHANLSTVHAPGVETGGVSAARPGEPFGLCATPPIAGQCAPAGESDSDVSAIYKGMVNVIYDIAPAGRIDPFVGVGVGIVHIQWLTNYWFSNVPGAVSPLNPPVQSLKLAGTLTRPGEFGIQGLAGLSYRIAPKLRMDVTYRYYFTPGDLRWNPVNYTSPGLPLGQGLRPGDFLGRFDDQSVTAGLRYAF